MAAVLQMHGEIVKGLTNYYYTFIDVMDFKVCLLAELSFCFIPIKFLYTFYLFLFFHHHTPSRACDWSCTGLAFSLPILQKYIYNC